MIVFVLRIVFFFFFFEFVIFVRQVIFLALDDHVPNVVCTYSLEHKSIDGLFDSIFYRLNIILEQNERENVSKPYQELVLCIGTIHTFISQHMLKEEEQVRT